MTRKTLEKLTGTQLMQIEQFRKLRKVYEEFEFNRDTKLDTLRVERNAYIKGLRDAGAITERERQILSLYMTV